MIRASALDRIYNCPTSEVLPQVAREAGDDAARGTELHKYLSLVGTVGVDKALDQVDEEWRDACADIQIARLPINLSTEVAFAYDWRRDSARRIERYDELRDDEIPGRADIVGLEPVKVYVGDYKGPRAWLPKPSESMQLGFGLVAAARTYNRTRGVVEYLRLLPDGTHIRASAEIDAAGIELIAERIHDTMVRVEGLRKTTGVILNTSEGGWCTYCPARVYCPSRTATLRQILADPQPVPFSVAMTDDVAARAYRRLQAVKEVIKHAESALYAHAKLSPIPLGPDEAGREQFFGEFTREGNEVVDGRIAHRILTARYDGEAANRTVTMEVTKKAITDTAREKKNADSTIKSEVDAIMKAIRDANGTSRPETTTTTVYTIDTSGDARQKRK